MRRERSATANLETVWPDEPVDRFLIIIREAGHLGESGDGRVFVGNIRTGKAGRKAI